MRTFRFRFQLGELGPIAPSDLQAAMSRSLGAGHDLHVGVYGRVEGVRDGRPVGTQAIDVESSTTSEEAVLRALTVAMAALGLDCPLGRPEVWESDPARLAANE